MRTACLHGGITPTAQRHFIFSREFFTIFVQRIKALLLVQRPDLEEMDIRDPHDTTAILTLVQLLQ